MKHIALLATVLMSVSPLAVSAQETRDPVQVAQEQKVCDPALVADAKWLPDGRLQVSCGTGTAFFPAAAAAPLAGGLLLAVLGAGGSSSTTAPPASE